MILFFPFLLLFKQIFDLMFAKESVFKTISCFLCTFLEHILISCQKNQHGQIQNM
jgi:hypothetical protein